MVKLVGFIISLLLIGIIVLSIPQESIGLGSPSSAQRFLNILIAVGIFIYVGIALQLNFSST